MMERNGEKLGRTKPIGQALSSAAGPLMRQIRKYGAMEAFVAVLPRELDGLAVPYDLRLARRERPDGEGVEDLNVMFVWCTSATVQGVIELKKRQLMEQANARLPYKFVEDLRTEVAAPAKIARQLNILRAQPD
jgi:hypothetical protein